jgi:hypothetical protein
VPSDTTIRVFVTEQGSAEAGEPVDVDGVRALLGAASHCDVRLGPDRAAPEQLRFEVHNGQLFAEVRATSPVVLLNQLPFHQGRLLPDAVLTFGKLEVKVTLEQHLVTDGKQGEARVRPAFVAIALLLGVVLALALVKLSQRRPPVPAPVVPPLFAAEPAPRCPEESAEAARLAALEFVAQADAKRERAPFLPEEGLSAVPLYRAASACFARVGDAELARDQGMRADALQRYVERDYHLHQVRVYLAHRSEDMETLAHEARVLSRYLRDRSAPYSVWLDQRQREIEAKPKQKQKKRKG